MPIHFLLSADSREFTLERVAEMSRREVHEWFVKARWGDRGQQACPGCGRIDAHYWVKSRWQWRCRDIACGRMFSVTSGTAFADHKLPLRKLLQAMVLYMANVKGISACAMARIIKTTYQTAFVLLHKLRESIRINANLEPMDGLVQIDGAHVSGRLRKPRVKKPATKQQARDRVPAHAFPKHPNRRIVLVVREVSPEKGKGSKRTIVDIVQAEDEEAVIKVAKKYLKKGSTVWTDELAAYNVLGAYFDHRTVNHSREFSTDDGVNNNQAESFFSRMRRMIIGQVHRVTPVYMHNYVHEVRWREDSRRLDPRIMTRQLFSWVSLNQMSEWRGYWQRSRKGDPDALDGLIKDLGPDPTMLPSERNPDNLPGGWQPGPPGPPLDPGDPFDLDQLKFRRMEPKPPRFPMPTPAKGASTTRSALGGGRKGLPGAPRALPGGSNGGKGGGST